MSPSVAWAVTALCIAIVVVCSIELFMRQRSALRRVAIVMGVTLTIDILVAEFIPWQIMWLPLLASHLIAAWVVTMRPAATTHAIIGSLYAVLAVIDTAFALHGDKAIVWSLYMDMINFFTIAQAGALLMGVLSNGHRDYSSRRSTRRGGGNTIPHHSDIGLSR